MEIAKMNGPISRREALKNLALGAGTLLVAGAAGAAGAASPAAAKPPPPPGPLPHLVPTDPLAIALSYHASAKTVDAVKFPTYKPDQKCASCMQLTGKVGDPWRPCNLFPGKLVNAEGWCKVWLKKAPVT
jgi:high potential iron-sulfur protein